MEYAENWKIVQSYLGIGVDGWAGNGTRKAVANKLGVADDWKAIQRCVSAGIDGIAGALTASKVINYLNIEVPKAKFTPPRKESIISNRSCYGKAGDESNLVSIVPPYQLYYDGQKCKTIRVHRLIAEPVMEALKKVLEHYGIEEIKRLKLDQFDGCFNNRSIRGGNSSSMHSWGIAIDWWAAANGMNDKTGKAPFSKPEYKAWWDIWESVGARSFGRRNGYDWMHVEFVSPLVG